MFCILFVTAWTTILCWPMSVLPTPNNMDRGIDFWACWRHLQRVQPDGGGKLQAAPCSSSNDAIRKTTRTAVAGHVIFATLDCNSTIIQHTAWQLIFECVASPQNFFCYRTRGIIVGPPLRLCTGALGVSAAGAQVMLGGLRPCSPHPLAGGHHPHCKRPRGPPPAHLPSDPAFVPGLAAR